MNEQLVVKNFGPIKDATVDFKRVTVFIGPTGGGKSTLAKLASVFRDNDCAYDVSDYDLGQSVERLFSNYSLIGYQEKDNFIKWHSGLKEVTIIDDDVRASPLIPGFAKSRLDTLAKDAMALCKVRVKKGETIGSVSFLERLFQSLPEKIDTRFEQELSKIFPDALYIPADRVFASAIEGAVFGLRKNKIALPQMLENFMGDFENARKEVHFFEIDFLGISYSFSNGENKLQLQNKKVIDLSESASGVQSVLPLLLVVDYFTNDDMARSFVVEEPELNLYPTAQQKLLNRLTGRCTFNESSLTITTHSPYLLAHLNTLLFAYQVAEAHPDRADDVAKVVPRESWINPKEFAAYHVEGQQENGVRSIISAETGLISYNQLDALAGLNAEDFEKLLDINAGLEVE